MPAGCIVTFDAMGCQTNIADKIIEREVQYVLALKENQGNLHTDVVQLFDDLEAASTALMSSSMPSGVVKTAIILPA